MPNYMQNLVSVIIPTYKRSDSLLRAINSVLSQTYTKTEVIIVDDNDPNDSYSEIVQRKLSLIKDDRLRYIQQEKHINGAAARNTGIRAAKGEFIAFLDDDDEWLPNKLTTQVEKLKNNLDYGAISCLYTIYNNGIEIRKALSYTSDNLHKKVLERSVSIFTTTVLFRRTALDSSGYFDESFIRHQDLQLFLDFLIVNKMLVLPEFHANIHIDIGGNRPNGNKLIEIKKHFFDKMGVHLERYNKKIQQQILAAHYFEIILVALKEKNIKVVTKYLFKIGFNISAYFSLIKRYLDRRKGKI